jgi:hypothetical protein
MADPSNSLYSDRLSSMSVETSRGIMKVGLRSVIMSKLAFDCFREFNAVPTNDSNSIELPEGIDVGVVTLLQDDLPQGEVRFTTSFCKDNKIKKSATNHELTAHSEWTFNQTMADGSKRRPRSDIVFVRNAKVPDEGAEAMKTKRTPLALLEVGVTKTKGQTALDDKWFAKLGQGVKYIDLISSGSVSGQKRKFEPNDGSDYEQSQTSTATPIPSPTKQIGLLTLEKPILFFVIAFGKKRGIQQSGRRTMHEYWVLSLSEACSKAPGKRSSLQKLCDWRCGDCDCSVHHAETNLLVQQNIIG